MTIFWLQHMRSEPRRLTLKCQALITNLKLLELNCKGFIVIFFFGHCI